MGIFGKKGLSDSSVLMSMLVTLGQSINSVEEANNLRSNEAWDIYINTLAQLLETGFIPEDMVDQVSGMSKYPDNHRIKLDLELIRSQEDLVQAFVKENKSALEIIFSPKNISSKKDWIPTDFGDSLVKLTKRTFSDFGKTKKDQIFYAIISVYMMTLVVDSESDSASNRDFRRIIGFEFALRWLAQWNIATD